MHTAEVYKQEINNRFIHMTSAYKNYGANRELKPSLPVSRELDVFEKIKRLYHFFCRLITFNFSVLLYSTRDNPEFIYLTESVLIKLLKT